MLASRNERNAVAAFRDIRDADGGMERIRQTFVRFASGHKAKWSRPKDLQLLREGLRAVFTMISGIKQRAIMPLLEHSGFSAIVAGRDGNAPFGPYVYADIHHAALEAEQALESMEEFTAMAMQVAGPDRGGRASPAAKDHPGPLEWLARSLAFDWQASGRNFRKHDAEIFLHILRAMNEVITNCSVPPDDLDQIALPTPEHEHMAAERILLHRLLGLSRQTGKALAHVRHPGGQPDLGCSTGQGSSRQTTDQPGQRLRIIRPADPKTVPTCKLDLDLAIDDRMGCGCRSNRIDDLDRQETGRWPGSRRRACRKPQITQPFEDQVRIQRIPPGDLGDRHIPRGRLKADRPLLVIRPKPPRSPRHPQPHSVH